MAKTAARTKPSAPYSRPTTRVAQPTQAITNGKIPVKVDHLITEDDAPVDNMFSEKQQRLLTEPLYSSWRPLQPRSKSKRRKFLVAANVGVFCHNQTPDAAIVPDVFLSMDVTVAANWYAKEHRSYFIWEFGKAPELVVEIVSNRKGGELTTKPEKYALCGIPYYAVFDPTHALGKQTLRLYELRGGSYVQRTQKWWPKIGLGLTLWEGAYEDKEGIWLRWCDENGHVILTGAERAASEAARAEEQTARALRAEKALATARSAAARSQALAEKLRALGIDPDQV